MAAILRPHQEIGAKFLVDKGRAIIGDAKGLGKTLCAIHAAFSTKGPRPVLIVCPFHLLTMWEKALLDYDPRLAVRPCEGDASVREAILSARADAYIVNYEMLSRSSNYPTLLARPYDTVIFDESQFLRGRHSQWTMAASRIDAERVFMLSGSLQMKNAGDMFSPLHLLNPNEFRSYWAFINYWAEVVKTPFEYKVVRLKDKVEGRDGPTEFSTMLSHYLLARRWSDVGIEMPPAIHRNAEVTLERQEMHAISKAKKNFVRTHPTLGDVPIANAAALVTWMRKYISACGTKLAATRSVVETYPDDQVIIWAWFKETVNALAEVMSKLERPLFVITGDISQNERQRSLSYFRKRNDGILIATIASLSEGENLQTGHISIFHEEDYLAERNDQAVHRQRRLGQEYPVEVFHVRARRTVDMSVKRIAANREYQSTRALLYDIFREYADEDDLEEFEGNDGLSWNISP